MSALHQFNGIIYRKNNRKLNTAFAVKMPDNFPPVAKIASPGKNHEVLLAANTRLMEIADLINKGTHVSLAFHLFHL